MANVTGRVSASFIKAEGLTRLDDRSHAYPLKIAKAFPFDGGQLGVYVMDASPGILSGDHYELNWRFGEETSVYITNQSYTKVHPARCSLDSGANLQDSAPTEAPLTAFPLSQQKQTLWLMRGSYVEYMPEPLMLYKDALFSSTTEVHMEPDSALLMSDIVCPGRTQRGEIFQYIRYQNKLSVVYDGELIYTSKQRVEPGVRQFRGIGGWAEYTHNGSLYLFSNRVDEAFIEKLRELLDEMLQRPSGETKPSLFYGVSRTYKHGLIVSVLGHKVFEIQFLLDGVWQWIRRELFGKPPLQVRK